ncbi:MAG: ClpXP protease specificity-enhancing factor [Gammaproteobacteria bacterium]|nr:MAG: ClpXP protease specificity-enhancing factor [Gammaproteobacteria bacterium]
MTTDPNLSPTRPYMVRAIFQWIEDNHLTPYLMVDATHNQAKVPVEYIQDGRIVLNIASAAVGAMAMENDFISFKARFGGVSQEIWVPMQAVMGIYAKENSQGMFFDPNEYDNYQPTESSEVKSHSQNSNKPKRENKAGLKILK